MIFRRCHLLTITLQSLNENIDFKCLIQEKFKQQPGVFAALLFGSQLTGTAKLDSDIDLAVLYDYNSIPTPRELWEIKESISEKLNTPADLICLNNADTIIASPVLKNYKVFLVNDQIIANHLSDFTEFYRAVLQYCNQLKEH